MPEPLGAQEIQALLDDDTVLLAYTLSHERSYLWLVERHSIRGFCLAPRAQIETLAERYYSLLTRPSQDPELVRRQAAEGRDLARELLGPIAARLGRRRLVFLLDGKLNAVPFGTLPDPSFPDDREAPPLLANHEISYLPSASVLPVLRQRLAKPEWIPRTVAVFADAVYNRDDDHLPIGEPGSTSLGAWDFSPLPGSGREADAILDLVDRVASLSVRGFDATRETLLKTDFSRYRIVHLAVHGVLDENPWFSRLVLSEYNQRGQRHNGGVMLHDIYQLDIPVDLVVLSACDTARGKEVRGEGIVGLPRGFLYAGAARVVVSLWKVDDDATAELMKSFYREMLVEGRPPAAALRAAQLNLRRRPGWETPRYWAGFVLQGAW
ncbi:MAG: CHAT domain-containing protein [Thermoanaerobaculia bacterium]|nr:CHAT domain-containing protein [Thermoanaerobaculia bacterium]